MKQRNRWLDILKGIGIITVVLGHTGNDFTHHYFFWFHMPLFFILSGYLFNPIDNLNKLMKWSLRKFNRLMVPYISFGLCILGIVIIQDQNWSIESLIYGGRRLGFYYGVFWFVTCLLITQLVFAVITYVTRSKIIVGCIVVALYGLAHIREINQAILPWSINTVLIALPYYAIGYYSRCIIHKLRGIVVLFLGLIIVSGTIVLEQLDKLNYELDLKSGIYNQVTLDIVIPISCIIVLFHLSYILSKVWIGRVFESIGFASMTIMFLHIPIYILGQKYTDNGFLLGVAGIIISYTLHQFFKLSYITGFLFFGDVPKRNPKKHRIKNQQESLKVK